MKIVLDLDGTLCNIRKKWQDYSDVVPTKWAVEYVQKLKEAGHYIIIQTARHMETCKGNQWLINARVGQKTMDWLDRYAFPYDEIFFGKPNADIYIDDKANRYLGWENKQELLNYDQKKVNIVIPMAGAGSRFAKVWYDLPKPLIDVKWKMMFEWAAESFDFLKTGYKIQFIFVVLKEHVVDYKIDTIIEEKYPGSTVIVIDEITRGQAETVLKAKEYINSYEKLIIYNADTYSNYSLEDFPIGDTSIEGIIPCFDSDDARYSYAKLDEYGYVSEVAEKIVISNHATNGLYYFKLWKDFVYLAEQMIKRNELSGGEFYVGPLYTDLINAWKRVKICDVKENWVIGTPDELDYFIENYK